MFGGSIMHASSRGPRASSNHWIAAVSASLAKPLPCAHGASTQPASGPSIGGSMSRWKSQMPTSPQNRFS